MIQSGGDDVLSSDFYSDALLDLSPNLVIFITPSNTIARMSRIAREYFGIESGTDISGRSIFEFVQDPVLTLLIRTWFDKLDAGLSVDETFPLDRTGNDTWDWYQVRASNVVVDGRFGGRVFFITEITLLYSYKKILDTLMVSNPAEIVVFDRNFSILAASDKVAKESGCTSWRDLAGRSLRDLPQFDIAMIESMLDSVILTDEPARRVCKMQSGGSCAKWGHLDLRCIKSTAGIFGYMLSRFDITEEIRPKAVLDALMESTTEIITIVGPDENVEFVSRAFTDMLCIDDPKNVLHQNWKLLFRNADPEMREFAGRFGKGLDFDPVGTIQYKRGRDVFHCAYRIEPLSFQNEYFGIIAIGTDATELVKARDKAEEAALAKAAFLANMSHELRTPMNAVLGMNELLARSPLSPLQKNYVSQIRNSAGMLLSIINDILDFSRLEDKKLELSCAPYNLESLLRDVLNMAAVKIAEKELSFTVDVDPSVPLLLVGDALRIKQILINLLNNAVKFTDQGEVNLTVTGYAIHETGSFQLSLRVRDTGIGIPKERQLELFDRFARIENSRNRSVEGSGLGLAICKNLVSLMQGSLTLESEEGAGSVFTANIAQKISARQPYAAFPEPSALCVLVFVADPAVRRSVRKMAEYAGLRAEMTDSPLAFATRLDSGERPVTHAVFDHRSAYREAVFAARMHPEIRFLALLSLKDFIGSGKDSAVDFVFTPLEISTFARFLRGERVDFSASIPLVNTLGIDPQQFRVAGITVLVVDDSAVNRKVAEGFLQTLDIRVVEAESGEEALAKAREQRFDMIFMDHLMPGMDGPETARKIRAMTNCADIPIIALTANVGEAYQELYRNAGMNDYLFKPMEFSAFLACLKRWLPGEKAGSADGTAGATSAGAADSAIPAFNGGPAVSRGAESEELPAGVTGCESPVAAGTDWIPGLDRASGIEYTGSPGNLDMILKIFNRTAGKMLQKLDEGKSGGDAEAFRAAAHSLISSCANVGGVEISARARELEQAVIACDKAAVERLYPLVRSELVKIIAGVSRYLEGK